MDGSFVDPQTVNVRVVSEPEAWARQALCKVPLAHTVLAMLRFILQTAFLEKIYEEHRGQCYQALLSFPTIVQVISDALLKFHGSGRQAIEHAIENGQLPCQMRAVYDKLRRLPLSLSVALLQETAAVLRQMLPSMPSPLPACFAEFNVGILDGKKIKNVAKRLLCARGEPGKILGSMLLAWYDPVARMIAGIAVNRDGEANENSLVKQLVAYAHAKASKPHLWVCDALYCDLVQITLHRSNGDHFLLRYHPKISFTPDSERPAVEVEDKVNQRRLRQEWGWLGAEGDPRRAYVRRVHWLRDGQKPLIAVTDLTDSEKYPAEAVMELYLHRWTIETVFQEITELFSLRKLIGCTPEAVTFQAAFCMILYNIVQLVKANVAQVGPPEPLPIEDVSTKMLFTTMTEELRGLVAMVTPAELTDAVAPPLTLEEMRAWLREQLKGRWKKLWRKARNKTKRKYGPKPKCKGGHTSVHRLEKKHAELQKKPPGGGGELNET